MTFCAKERRLGCYKITNGLVNGVFVWACVPQTVKRKAVVMDKLHTHTWEKQLRSTILKNLTPLIIINKNHT